MIRVTFFLLIAAFFAQSQPVTTARTSNAEINSVITQQAQRLQAAPDEEAPPPTLLSCVVDKLVHAVKYICEQNYETETDAAKKARKIELCLDAVKVHELAKCNTIPDMGPGKVGAGICEDFESKVKVPVQAAYKGIKMSACGCGNPNTWKLPPQYLFDCSTDMGLSILLGGCEHFKQSGSAGEAEARYAKCFEIIALNDDAKCRASFEAGYCDGFKLVKKDMLNKWKAVSGICQQAARGEPLLQQARQDLAASRAANPSTSTGPETQIKATMEKQVSAGTVSETVLNPVMVVGVFEAIFAIVLLHKYNSLNTKRNQIALLEFGSNA